MQKCRFFIIHKLIHREKEGNIALQKLTKPEMLPIII